MVNWRSLMVLGGVLALGGPSAGCGTGAGADDNGTHAALTKAEFIKQGDAICQRSNEREVAGFARLERSNGAREATPAEQLRVVVLPAVRTETEEIAGLRPPPADQAKVDAIIAALEAGVAEGEENLSNLLDGSSDQFTKAFTLLQEYGFKVCGVS